MVGKLTANLSNTILKNIPDVVYIMDFEDRLTYVNPSVYGVFGYKEKEVVGKKIYDFMSPKMYEIQRNQMLKAFNAKKYEESEKFIVRLLHKNGKYVEVEVHAHFLLDVKRKPYAVLGVARSIR